MDIGGASVIMGDCAIVFKRECFYKQRLVIHVTAADFGTRSFNLYYKFTDAESGQLVCEAKTGMVCYDYTLHKTVSVPHSFAQLFAATQWLLAYTIVMRIVVINFVTHVEELKKTNRKTFSVRKAQGI